LTRRPRRIAPLTLSPQNDLAPRKRRVRTPKAAPVETGPDLAKIALTSLDDSKAENIVYIDLHGKTSLADTMIVATGRSSTHVGAIADHILRAWKASGLRAPRIEGLPHCDWVLIDAYDIIIHIFKPDVRQFYNLEKMWGADRPHERAAKA
jgi:ribosome-associated protein